MKRFCISYLDHNQGDNSISWLYLRADSEEQLRDMFIEYEIISIREAEL